MNMKHLVVLTLAALAKQSFGAGDRLDNPLTELAALGMGKSECAATFDFADKKNGDLSLRMERKTGSGAVAIDFTPGLDAAPWALADGARVHLWIRAPRAGSMSIVLVDQRDRLASGQFHVTSEWGEVWIPIDSLSRPADFDQRAVTAVRFGGSLAAGESLRVDDLCFETGGVMIGVTDKTLTEHIAYAEATRKSRVAAALRKPATVGLREGLTRFFAEYALGETLERTNAELLAILTSRDLPLREKMRLNDHWCLVTNQTLYRIYFLFGSKGRLYPGRMASEVERALLSELWDRTVSKNDIALTKHSTWWMIGSENHDIVAKVSNLLTSQIFMHEEEYAKRILPDLGTGGGAGYWFSSMYGGATDPGPNGRANEKDGSPYAAADHYAAWVEFWKEYLAERGRKGFFLEHASPSYMLTTVSHLYDIADLVEDPKLREQARRFIDLIWAEWSQDQIAGVRGGAKTRVGAPLRYRDYSYEMAEFELGGASTCHGNMLALLLSNYRVPRIVWALALDREGLGEFAYVSRKPGEEPGKWPRPPGTERTLICDADARFRRESWVTPDYILGTQMDHPSAVHSQLSLGGRWQGVTFASVTGTRVFPTGFNRPAEASADWVMSPGFFRTVQSGRVMIAQDCRNYTYVAPDWFPLPDLRTEKIGVFFGTDYDERVERDGWIFVRKGNGYLAVKPILGEFHSGYVLNRDKVGEGAPPILPGAYTWNADHSSILLTHRYSPIVFEASRRAVHPTMRAFIDAILSNKISLSRTVNPGHYILQYRGSGREAEQIVFNAANNEIPTIGGRLVDYEPKAFDSPWIQGAYGSGKVTVRRGAEQLVLDLNPLK